MPQDGIAIVERPLLNNFFEPALFDAPAGRSPANDGNIRVGGFNSGINRLEKLDIIFGRTANVVWTPQADANIPFVPYLVKSDVLSKLE